MHALVEVEGHVAANDPRLDFLAAASRPLVLAGTPFQWAALRDHAAPSAGNR